MTKRILVVDDEKDIRKVVQIALEKFAGWQTVLAESGQMGLEKARMGHFDAILLDVSMPDIDGFQFYEALQQAAATRAIPVVLLTAKVLPRDRKRFDEMGIAGVITKPFNPVSIWQDIAHLLGWQVV